MEKQRGMAFGFRKTATAVIKPDGWMDGRTDGWMDGWMVGWMDGWMDRWIDRCEIPNKPAHIALYTFTRICHVFIHKPGDCPAVLKHVACLVLVTETKCFLHGTSSDFEYNTTHIPLICDNSITTQNVWFLQERLLKVSKCYNFLWVQRRHNCSPAASFANCVMTPYPLKVHLINVSFYTNN